MGETAEKLAALTAELSKTFVLYSLQFSELAGTDPLVKPPEAEGGKKKKKKRIIDPNAPKKPHSAYVQYLQDTREQIVKQNPDLKQTEIMAKIGNLWSNLAEKTKKKYEVNYQKELKKYEVEFNKYRESKGEPPLSPKKSKSSPKKAAKSGTKRKSPGRDTKAKKKKK
mmetsp:Transcript_10459/g.13090  ORF Transcript_10459/g.13090 Transcript_10459/m.13090 type:complete len:168 (-) Transcript_10459:117-620(-)|eukprot:CAMPEP_0204822692 /NCGR_PEP_ID=MMETSP1346-20131115/865_1 /ASSEMBLY_ACC=CAM_ASM_000771 /TAXON_ID=215587 /ORGANISM="Aplanochytrium stocchinoi, Strain GSBS06" /LENGTH=167 /DNA_ID=CAMNT_0051949037 /DNA_START=270 /DNA_END=773 /DNA_ORIENTATION=+